MVDHIGADVLIVGSGIAGSLLAERLASQDTKVAILEAGPRIDRPDAVERFWKAELKFPESPYPMSRETPHPTVADLDAWYVQAGPDKFKSTYLKVVGGTTWHWLGTCLRFLPDDFRLRTKYGRGVDWPVQYEDLVPWYEAAEKAIGVSGDSHEFLGSPRGASYPMPPIPQTWLDRRFAEALAGTEYEVRATPQARNSVEYDDRPACCGSASCIPICPVQAKYDATVHLKKAELKGVAVHAETTATFIEVGAQDAIAAIHFRRSDGTSGRATAKVFVLAAHAIETPRLLLASHAEKAPNGVANGSDQVGRNLMDHPTQLTWAQSRDPVWPYRGPLSTSRIENLRTGPWRDNRGAFRIEIGNDGWSWPTGAPISTASELAKQGLRGAALDTQLRDHAARHVRLAALVEQLPDADNRIVLDHDASDGFGIPRPRVHFRLDEYVQNGLAAARAVHEDVLRRLGVTGVWHREQAEGPGHIIGTTRMGTDPNKSVVDANLRTHEHPNLFILGSGVFPTSGTANPTLTIAALSLRATASVMRALAG
jgi:choline dehydrogenase-like flavoprotein